MRITKLIFENINSLYGKWTIDFTSPEFADGLFAITGNTGSGKTSILDAISLALFSITPRMEKDRVEILSKGAKYLSSELSFVIDSGEHRGNYTVKFSARKKRNDSNELSSPLGHVLYKDEKPIAENISEVSKKIVEITGLNEKQFCQTVMLAQGNFNAFLKADEKSKAAILEELTGTTVFSKISAEVYKKYDEQKNKIELLQAELKGTVLLTDEEISAKKDEIRNLAGERQKLQESSEQIKVLAGYGTKRTELQRTLNQNEMENKSLNIEQIEFREKGEKLDLHTKASALTPVFVVWDKLREDDLKDRGTYQKLTIQLPQKTESLRQCRENAAAALKQFEDLSAEIVTKEKLWLEVEQLDTEAELLQKKISIDSASAQGLEEQLQKEMEKLNAEKNLLQKASDKKESAEQYSMAFASDLKLPEMKATWQEQLNNLKKLNQEEELAEKRYKAVSQQIKDANAAVEAARKNTESAEKKYSAAEAEKKQIAQKLTDLLSGTTLEALETLEKTQRDNVLLRKQILNLSDMRKELIDGKECPLCGSKTHPFTQGNIPELTKAETEWHATEERLKQCRLAKEKLQEAENLCIKLKSELTLAQTKQSELQSKTDSLTNENLAMYEQELSAKKEEKKVLTETLSHTFSDFGISYQKGITMPAAVDQRIAAYAAALEELKQFEIVKAAAEQEIMRLKTLVEEHSSALTADKTMLKESESQWNQLKEKRKELFGTKDPKKIRKEFSDQKESLQRTFQELEKQRVSAETDLKNLNASIKELEIVLDERKPALKKAEQNFHEISVSRGFSEESYKAACLPESAVIEFTKKREFLNNRAVFLKEQKEKLETQLAEITARIPENTDFEKLAIELKESDAEILEFTRNIGSIENVLTEDQKNKLKYDTKLQEIENEKKSFALLENLNALIGSANGAKFSKIAQGITLDRLLFEANKELKKMFPRYELIRHKAKNNENQLDIDVVDYHQGGNIRTIGNLSGGETFLISLSLALGLSAMAGEKITVQTLFMDEGFGSLDSTAREYALETLSEVQRSEGKMIGIISHVPEIREKIPCLLEVTPIGNGMSKISGPGVLNE